MERPSHIIFERHQPVSRRVLLFAMAISLQLAGFWLFTHGLANGILHFIPPNIQVVPIPETPVPPAKPPEPLLKNAEIPVVPQPIYTVEQPSSTGGITTTTLPPVIDNPGGKQPQNIVRAAVGIVSTHTVPPYPPIARRIGAEGKVTLRLTVSAEGRVTKADVMTSSGRDELDQTAQAWILAHWTYKPASENGVPVASNVLATVTFSLAAER
jgi:protein TonB